MASHFWAILKWTTSVGFRDLPNQVSLRHRPTTYSQRLPVGVGPSVQDNNAIDAAIENLAAPLCGPKAFVVDRKALVPRPHSWGRVERKALGFRECAE